LIVNSLTSEEPVNWREVETVQVVLGLVVLGLVVLGLVVLGLVALAPALGEQMSHRWDHHILDTLLQLHHIGDNLELLRSYRPRVILGSWATSLVVIA
jgi:glycosyltransferase A (GT-A) superfamily protein (DUF2064 family)